MNKRALVIDGNNRAWAAFHAYDKLSWKGFSVSMIYGLPSMIKGLLTYLDPADVIIVWDGKRSKHRLELYPNYKGERKHKGLVDYENFLEQKAITKKLFYTLGVKQVINPGAEADDMIYKLTRVLRRKGYNDIIIVSGDKDFNQLLSREVSVLRETKKGKLHIQWNNCAANYGYHGWQTVDWLTLVGDDSDNISGYPQIGEKRAKDFLHKYGSIENFLNSKDKHPIIDKEKLLALKERNEILLDLRTYYHHYKDELKVKFYKSDSKPKVNKREFLKIVGKFSMKKMLGSNFIQAFKTLQHE